MAAAVNRSVTLQAASERMGVSTDALREWCRNHGCPADAIKDPNGRTLYYLVNVVEARNWRKSRRHGNLGKRRADDAVGGAS